MTGFGREDVSVYADQRQSVERPLAHAETDPASADNAACGRWLASEGDNAISQMRGHWWVLHTRSRNEKAIGKTLAQKRVQHYLPLIDVHHTYAKSKATFRVPLFPGYLFLCGDYADRDTAWQTNRVVNILDVADQDRLRRELGQVYRAVEHGRGVDLYPSLRSGQQCRLTGGPLKGLEGVVIRHGSNCRMYLSVAMLGQSAVVEVDAALLEAAG